ncbi:MAG: 23S rRNA (adenine(2503)-C(2))-methyltransferase RlmN [Terrimicrobiaceae bacterium]|nr:23S rRNA (adenine(2503)-C(2))-methyltransferase RlmN [Terrimicrobiaceae bacterium]
MHSIKSLTLDELAGRFADLGEPAYRARQVIEWLYRKRVGRFGEMTNLPAALREKLSAEFDEQPLEVACRTGSDDTTRKFLFRLRDGQMVETVLIPASPALYGEASDRRTICISSQVGCAYGCKFCASGLDGWKRNLDAGEIVDQFLRVEGESGERINNIVFMGMGEPLANYDHLLRAIGILNAPWGAGVGARHITVSTSGLVPRIRDLADQPLSIRLAISLHGATDEVRDRIMPVNKRYPLAELLEACRYFRGRKKQKLTFEFILIKGVNDSLAQAGELGRITTRLDAKVNVIPYNTVEGLSWERPSERVQDAFMEELRRGGAVATIRREKGHDIAAACGQLRLRTLADETAETGGSTRGSEKPVAADAGVN